MWAFIIRRILYNIPVYFAIILLVMALLRIRDPLAGTMGKNPKKEDYQAKKAELGLDRTFFEQYFSHLGNVLTLNFDRQTWNEPGVSVGEKLQHAVVPSLMLTIPALILTSLISIFIGMLSAFARGRFLDKSLVFFAVLGMSISFLVYIVLGQYFVAYRLAESVGKPLFSIHGYDSDLRYWPHFMLLPVMISVIVSMGYDTRFYRAVMVEEVGKDYITTAKSKGASRGKVMFVHMLRNAMIPIITRIMITLPFLVTGSILLENFFGIPGMGFVLISAINNNDFPVIETFTSVFAALFIASIIATDVMYALVDPRVRLQ